MLEPSVQPFKEPRGFMRVLQWLFSICAFATTVDYFGEFGFQMTSYGPGGDIRESSKAVGLMSYPFSLETKHFKFYPPLQSKQPDFEDIPSASGESVFFVFTGVVTFLYATATILLYLLADKIFVENNKIALADFFVTIILAVCWLASAAIWASGVSTIAAVMKGETWVGRTKTCVHDFKCDSFYYANHSKLIVSVLFGFINFILWTGNIWFLYKHVAHIFQNSLGLGGGGGGGGQNSRQRYAGGDSQP